MGLQTQISKRGKKVWWEKLKVEKMKILDSVLQGKIVKESYKEGATVVSLAKKYGVSTSAIHRWRQNSSSEGKIEVVTGWANSSIKMALNVKFITNNKWL